MSTHEQWDIVSSVGLTALVVAAGRSVDTHRADGLIVDPWAELFVQAAHAPVPLPTRPTPPKDDSEDEAWQMMSGYMGVRTRYFDTYLRAAADAGVRQVVILAAGLDTRAQRLSWPADLDLYEVDQPAVLAFKDSVLVEHHATTDCRRRPVAADLRDDWSTALVEDGFDPGAPTAWLAEGLLPYLPGEAQAALIDTVSELSAPGSRIAIENFTNLLHQMNDPVFRRISLSLGVDMPALLHDDVRDDPADLLRQHRWDITTDVADHVAAEYGRTLDPLTVRLNGKSLFQRATR